MNPIAGRLGCPLIAPIDSKPSKGSGMGSFWFGRAIARQMASKGPLYAPLAATTDAILTRRIDPHHWLNSVLENGRRAKRLGE